MNMNFTQVEGRYPPRHERILVERDGRYFVATPCYGMHDPWWVPMTPNGESEPVNILGTDKWIPLKDILVR